MKNTKGISMISLVIAIIVTIILIGIATTAGYRYIVEGNKAKAEAVISIISEAAYRRQNDLSSGVATAYYEGYSFLVDGAEKYLEMTGLPADDKINIAGEPVADGIPDCLQENGAKWYLFDAESAKALGIYEAERFITRNISYPAGLDEDEVTLVLADYSSGAGYLVNMPTDAISDSVRQEGGCLNSPTGNHNYKIIATCTKPALCIYCGEADPLTPALGHDFSDPTCTTAGICRRCGAVDPENGPLGHLMISNADMADVNIVEALNRRDCRIYVNTDGNLDSANVAAWVTDALKHWHECIRCGEKTEEKAHSKGDVPIDKDFHYTICSECGWESIKAKHVFIYTSLTSDTHMRKCKICLYEETHADTGWLPGNPDYHHRICKENSECNNDKLIVDGNETKIIFKEAHYDLNDDLICDVCGQSLDKDPPHGFDDHKDSYGKMIDATTSTIIVEAFTTDEHAGVKYYQFGIYNPDTKKIDWHEKKESNADGTGVDTFDNLKPDTEYDIYVKAFDEIGNVTEPYKIPDTKTEKFPKFYGLTNIPDDYVRGPIYAGIAPIETELENIVVEYSLDNGNTWTFIPIADIETEIITLTKETEKVMIRFADDANPKNTSDIWEYVIEKIDITPPTVDIATKAGDNNEILATYHVARVTLADAKSGLASKTEVRYAWSTSNTEVPTNFETILTENDVTASNVSFNLVTPQGANGTYYLWILEGVKDRVGNPTTEPVCSEFAFVVDDEEVEVTNIRMEDLSPAVEKEFLFVKTDGVVTISFETNKKLGVEPVVTLNGKKVTIVTSEDGLSHRGVITITDSFEEGILELEISNIVSESGKVNTKTYTNEDLTVGPVIYDRTLPVLEYISKQ